MCKCVCVCVGWRRMMQLACMHSRHCRLFCRANTNICSNPTVAWIKFCTRLPFVIERARCFGFYNCPSPASRGVSTSVLTLEMALQTRDRVRRHKSILQSISTGQSERFGNVLQTRDRVRRHKSILQSISTGQSERFGTLTYSSRINSCNCNPLSQTIHMCQATAYSKK
jgi:hypothetical protein